MTTQQATGEALAGPVHRAGVETHGGKRAGIGVQLNRLDTAAAQIGKDCGIRLALGQPVTPLLEEECDAGTGAGVLDVPDPFRMQRAGTDA